MSPSDLTTLPPGLSASVIVVTYNNESYIRQCLEALFNSAYPILELVVVDNASRDGSSRVVEDDFPSARLIRSPRNLGFAGGCNLGFAEARGQIVALVNPDVIVQPSWLGELAAAFAADPALGIAGGKLLYPDRRTVQHAGGLIRYPLALADHHGYGQPDDGKWDECREVDYVTGAALAIRREVLDRIGGFDERFFPAYFEETDLCWRARRAGFEVAYVPSAVATHYESTSTGKESYSYYYYYHVNRLRFVLKNYSPDQLLMDFFPAEIERLEIISPDAEIRALDRAYREILDDLRISAAEEGPSEAPTKPESAMIEPIQRLSWRASEIAVARSLAGSLNSVFAELNAISQIPEPCFRSSFPVLGPAIAFFRSAWNWVSTKWYVRQILQEQNAVNARLVRCLDDVARQLIELQQRVDRMEQSACENRVFQSSEPGEERDRGL